MTGCIHTRVYLMTNTDNLDQSCVYAGFSQYFPVSFIRSFELLLQNAILTGITLLFLLSLCIFLIRLAMKYRKQNTGLEKMLQKEGVFSDSNLLHNLIENLPDFIYVKDENSNFILANDKLGRFMGKSSGYELTGKSDHDFFPKHLADEYRKNEIEVMVTDSPILFKIEKSRDRDGREIFIRTSKIPFHDREGKVIGIVGIGTDVTEAMKTSEQLEQKNRELHEINVLLKEKQEEILEHQEELKVSAERLLEEKNQLRTLIDNMPDRIYIKDRKSRFVVGNIHLAKLLKLKSPDELIGKTDFDLHPKESAEEFFRDEQRIMSSGIPLINKEEKGKDLQGMEAVISTTKVPVRDEFGSVIGIVGIGREITKYKHNELKLIEQQHDLMEVNELLREKQEQINIQTEELKKRSQQVLKVNEELEKLSLVARSTDNVIIIMDAEGNFEWVNHGFESRYGMNISEYTKTKGRNLRENSFNENIRNILDEVILTRKPCIYDSKGMDQNGNIIWLQTTISPVLDDQGAITRLIAIDSDITRLKEAEDKISRQKEEIEIQRDELKKVNATKDKFFSIIAHDLKNPFHSIIGFTDLLLNNYDQIEDEKKKEFLHMISDSSSTAHILLENLLNWTMSQTNRINYEPVMVNLTKIINQIILMLGIQAKNKEISITTVIPPDLTVFADANMLDAIIRNLLTNAIKFTRQGGEVSIICVQEGDRISISVTDNGIGMDEDTKSRLSRFDEFMNTPGTSGEKGTGLGLIVCKEFIEKHGSKLSVQSRKNKGSSFSFSLPSGPVNF